MKAQILLLFTGFRGGKTNAYPTAIVIDGDTTVPVDYAMYLIAD